MTRFAITAVIALLGCARDDVSLGASAPCPDASAACVAGGRRACIDLRRSMEHCGACGHRCPDAGVCHLGACCPNGCMGLCLGGQTRTIEITAGRESVGQYLVDIDRDGYDDAASVNQLSADLTVVWGNPEGRTDVTDTWPIRRVNGDVAFGDIDGDGDVDMVATVQTNGPPTALHIGVYLRARGRGPPSAPTLLREPGNPDEIALGDFDGDRDLDVIARRMDTGCLALRLGDGRGGFGEGRCVAMTPVGYSRPNGIAVPMLAADLDGDRRAELLLREGPSLKVIRFDPSGVAGAPREVYRFAATSGDAAGYDLDGDGRTELALSVPNGDGTHRAEWLSLDGEARVTPRCAVAMGANGYNRVGDFNGDGIPDAVNSRGCAGCRDLLLLHLRH